MRALLDAALTHHRAGRLDEAVALYMQSLEAAPDCALAWNMLGNIEYQRDHVEEALRLIGRAIELDPRSAPYRITLGHVHRRVGDLSMAATCYREALRLSPESTLAATNLARTLNGQGEPEQSAEVLRQILARDPDHLEALALLGEAWLALDRPVDAAHVFGHLVELAPSSAKAWFGRGVASSRQDENARAIECFERAVLLEPDFAEALYNLGVIDVERQELGVAEAWFRRAVAARPEYVEAHVNLSAVLLRTGRVAQARAHRDIAYRRQCLFAQASRTARRTVLVLFDAGKGNINLGHLFSRRHNSVIDWMIEYAPHGQADVLPAFDLVFNAMGDPDLAGAAVLSARRFVDGCAAPVLNRPESVSLTSREKIPVLLRGIDGLVVPKTWRVAPASTWPTELVDHLPLLVRPVDTHGGAGLRQVTTVDELDRIAAQIDEPLYVSPFCDFRSTDGWYRKYRIVFIDRQPFAYHLAITPHWLVHYATAGMQAHPWKLEEERRFLERPHAVLGAAGMAAIAEIGARMNLDYAGVDFSILADGRVLLFEANPVMLVHPESTQGVLAFKNEHVDRILDAFEALLCRLSDRAGLRPPAPPSSARAPSGGACGCGSISA